ncbi:hypothetical protein AVEN_149756-1 [Araneus ventricosus]|uniref:Uncharacterized protein n=1 Tax=Araneus ventricosus TaxID=182803 RepID=A0A4Y2RLM2_ARAVE|nr:hypothetical protein AVEN_149756-1 [Araneus ventricosus]
MFRAVFGTRLPGDKVLAIGPKISRFETLFLQIPRFMWAWFPLNPKSMVKYPSVGMMWKIREVSSSSSDQGSKLRDLPQKRRSYLFERGR